MALGTKYNILSCGGVFFANAVDCLAAIRQVVYEKKEATLDEVAAACRDNFKGHERLRAKLIAAPKHGNDDPRLDYIITLVEQLRDVPMKEICRDPRDGTKFGNTHITKAAAVLGGKATPATPDGRLAGTPLASSVAASAGAERSRPHRRAQLRLQTQRRQKLAERLPGEHPLPKLAVRQQVQPRQHPRDAQRLLRTTAGRRCRSTPSTPRCSARRRRTPASTATSSSASPASANSSST